MHVPHGLLMRLQFGRRDARRHARQQFAPVGAGQQFALGGAVGIAEFDLHQEAVELRFGQRESADLVRRVLRGDDEEGGR